MSIKIRNAKERYKFSINMETRWRDLDSFQHVNNAVFATYFENASNRFVKSVENDWNHWPSHLELGKIAKDNEEWQKAEMHFKIVLDLDPKNKTASKLLDGLGKALPG